MPLLTLMVVIVIVGVLLWAVNAYVPMAAPVKNILNIVVIVVLVLFILQAFGILGGLNNVQVPRVN